MDAERVRTTGFAMPLTNPAYPPGPDPRYYTSRP
jgi:acetoacetate decarboxylase